MSERSSSNILQVEEDLFGATADELYALARSLDGPCELLPVVLQVSKAVAVFDRILPQRAGWWTNPFNGQQGRRDLFLRMIDLLDPAALVETGTFRGTTAAFMADHFSGSIFTCEIDPRWYFTAKEVLARFPHVKVRLEDSREFLREIHDEVGSGPLIYYLDAHWREELPLCAELDMILERARPCAIMIDDFAVPDDPGYQYDDYGPGKALCLELLAQVAQRDAALFFPTLPSNEENGACRGCAVIAVGDAIAALALLPELRPYAWPRYSTSALPPPAAPRQYPDLANARRLVAARGMEARIPILEAEVDSQRQHAEKAEADLEAARKEIERLQHERMKLQEEKAMLLGSTSWRITAPLRSIAPLVGARWRKT